MVSDMTEWQPDKSFIPLPLVLSSLIEDAARSVNPIKELGRILVDPTNREIVLKALREFGYGRIPASRVDRLETAPDGH